MSAPHLAPIQRAGVEQGLAHAGIKICDGQRFFKQLAVDVGKGSELLVQRLAALLLRRVEHLEALREQRAEIAAVRRGAVLDPILEGFARLEDAGVFGEQAEQQAHQQDLKRVAFEAAGLEAVMQPAHALGSLGVDRVFRRELLRAVPGNECEQADMLVQLRDGKLLLVAGIQIVQAQVLEVGHQHVAGQVAFRDAGEVVQRLAVGAVEVLAAALVLGDEHAFPEQVDLAAPVAELAHRLLETGHAPPC